MIRSILIFLLLMSLTPLVSGQESKALIYGTIITDSEEEYTGFIRWGKEEMYWHDIFNARKEDNFKSPPASEDKLLNKIDWSLKSIWQDEVCGSCNSHHSFACFFGDIWQIKPLRGERAQLTFKDGSTINVDGSGTNDIGRRINMVDYELGKIRFDWDDIELISFSAVPADMESPYGKSLYGKVTTERRKQYTGFIQWDMDERNGDDILDGDSRYGDQKIPFEKIKIIRKVDLGDAVEITFESGRKVALDGSNDCDSGNRGIGIQNPEIGHIEVEWEEFEQVEFLPAPSVIKSYFDYEVNRNINAEIFTFDDQHHTGMIAFDRDEVWDFEFLDGADDDIEFMIPFRNITKVVPKNRSFSMVHLVNGDVLLLGSKQDVSSDNDGIILINSDTGGLSIEWKSIDKVIINKSK